MSIYSSFAVLRYAIFREL